MKSIWSIQDNTNKKATKYNKMASWIQKNVLNNKPHLHLNLLKIEWEMPKILHIALHLVTRLREGFHLCAHSSSTDISSRRVNRKAKRNIRQQVDDSLPTQTE